MLFNTEDSTGEINADKGIINDTDKWIFLEIQFQRAKKNDHVFHNACMTYIIKYYDKQRQHANKEPIPINIVWSDNCPTQYRCRQNFLQVAIASSKHTHTNQL